MDTDHNLIISLLKRGKLTQGEIAERAGCSRHTVARLAKKHDLQWGRGVKHKWHFSGSSPELCYLIGMYVADGTIGKRYRDGKLNAVKYSTITPEIMDHLEFCLSAIALPVTRTKVPYGPRSAQEGLFPTNGGTMLYVNCFSALFARWLNRVCHYKDRLPAFLFDVPISHQIATISGIIDGDGTVGKNGAIRLKGVDGWLQDFPRLLECAGIRTPGLRLEKVLASGKKLYSLSIRRQDFVALGGRCYHPVKQARILHGKTPYNAQVLAEMQERRRAKMPLCPFCETNRMDPDSEMCRACYLKSDKFHDHLKRIAPIGNKAANKARWGYEG